MDRIVLGVQPLYIKRRWLFCCESCVLFVIIFSEVDLSGWDRPKQNTLSDVVCYALAAVCLPNPELPV